MKRLLLALVLASVAAGQAWAGKVETDFNPRLDFAKFETWDWIPDRDQGHRGILAGKPAREMVEQAVARELEHVGLRKAAAGETPDLLVRYYGDIAEAAQGTSTTSPYMISPFTDGYWAPAFQSASRFSEKSAAFMIDLIESSEKSLAWRAYIEQKYGSANNVGTPVADALRKAFGKYPPSDSAKSKKLKEWAKLDAEK